MRDEHVIDEGDRTLLDPDALDRASVLAYAASLAKEQGNDDATRLDEAPLDVTKLYDDDEERPAFLDEVLRERAQNKLARSFADLERAESKDDTSDATMTSVVPEATRPHDSFDSEKFGTQPDAQFGTQPDQPAYQDKLGQDEPTLLGEDVFDLISIDDLMGGPDSDATVQISKDDVTRIADSTIQLDDDDLEEEEEDGTSDTAVKPRLTLSELRASLRKAVSAAEGRSAASSLGEPVTEGEDDSLSEESDVDHTMKMDAASIQRVAAGLDELTGPPEDGTLQLDQNDIFDAVSAYKEMDLEPEIEIEIEPEVEPDVELEIEPDAMGATVEQRAFRKPKMAHDHTEKERRLDEDAIEAAIALAEAALPRDQTAEEPELPTPDPWDDNDVSPSRPVALFEEPAYRSPSRAHDEGHEAAGFPPASAPLQQDFGQEPYAQEPQTQLPQGQAPQAPYGQDPYAQQQDPYGQQPYAQQPYPQDPQAQAPYGQDPYAQQPYPQDPYAQPYGQDPNAQYPNQGPPGHMNQPPMAAPPTAKRKGAKLEIALMIAIAVVFIIGVVLVVLSL